jgi:hypothetical protein
MQQRLPARRDDLQAPFWTMLALGAVSATLLVLGLGNLIVASMPWAHTGLKVQVTGVYPYDPQAHTVSGTATTTFRSGELFAGRVSWDSLPATLEVGGVWYDSQQQQVTSPAPQEAGQLAAQQAVVPMTDTRLLPGRYQLLVMHYVDGRPIEILGRRTVKVTSS